LSLTVLFLSVSVPKFEMPPPAISKPFRMVTPLIVAVVLKM
jgi:hypothetical protein